eukprot:gnl/TRDRNA2_/TRDRNA2_176008_c0_seq1.p1 gnl/TRDRNA2_/TRDRNA2_176008_c0~~gnl/TRDRNA2_/TRDRNA2_176008_c0_seq1.p1  ORF type:complete len:938 (+),score=226.31 gnl/TRDRNA2_/TRDRNA2_176008_c0_seq1:89-2902(+)
MAFTSGMLVEIAGLADKVAPLDLSEPVDLNGVKAQIQEFQRESGKWIVATFNALFVAIDAKYLRELGASELSAFDLVWGPKSDQQIIGEEIGAALEKKGFAMMKICFSDEDTQAVKDIATKLDEDDEFTRVATEFEPGYLGQDTIGKTVLVDPSDPRAADYITECKPLKTIDNNFTAMSEMLKPFASEKLGFDIYSRTNLLLRSPLGDDDEDKYPPQDVDDGDAEGFLFLMHRRKITLIFFLNGGTLRLIPKLGENDIEMKVEPHTYFFLVNSRYDYCYTADKEDSLALQAFFLTQPPVWNLNDVAGDLTNLSTLGQGPPPPPGKHCSVDSIYVRYGCHSDGMNQFWCAVGKATTDGVTEIPIIRWDHGPYYDPNQERGLAYTKHGDFGIEGVDLFDCRFFEVSPAEARGMDPVQRQILESSYVALLGGGWDKKSLQRQSENIGHYVGIDKDDWQFMNVGGDGAFASSSACNAINANRFNYALNLKGPSMTIDTACSSSLVCTHVAKLSIRNSENDPIPANIVQGCNLMLNPGPFIGCCGSNMLSHEGRCFTFNATADGYLRGEETGAICIKMHQFNPDTSLALVAGSNTNQDGRSASLTAPNGPAQERLLKGVLRETKLTPTEIDCIECHGTGTALGDPIEVGSFRRVMSETQRTEPLVITSSKSNLGHGEGGAGLAGFVKCCMQVSHCEGASNVHLKVLNPHLEFDGFPCQVLTECVTMREDSAYSGVSSFGFGGTNAHAEAWSKNIFTSRGAGQQDPQKVFQKKLANAPPPEITMSGDPEEWETTGMDPRAGPGDRYEVTLDEDGVTTWEKVEDDDPTSFGDEFFLRGTFNSWAAEDMERHESIEGLWTGKIHLGSTGQETFQIMADNDEDMLYFPDMENCTMKAAPVQGPGKAEKTKCWMIKGEPYDTYDIEFFQQGKQRSILWMKGTAIEEE